MKVPNCPDHENLVLELARGLLDDREALRAENVRQGCVPCKAWWSETFNSEAMAAVDEAVAESFSSFRAPARRRRAWLAAAAAAVLAVGIGATTVFWSGSGERQAGPVAPESSGAVLATWDFEDGEVSAVSASVSDVPTPDVEHVGDPAVFKSDLESGNLSGWSSHS
jgi:hypothetical protein